MKATHTLACSWSVKVIEGQKHALIMTALVTPRPYILVAQGLHTCGNAVSHFSIKSTKAEKRVPSSTSQGNVDILP